MLSIPHALSGAFIASKIPHPLIYIPAALALHYLQDWMPHWDFGTGLSSGKRKRATAIVLEVGDLVVTAALVYFFWKEHVGTSLFWHICAGAFAGLLPDFIEAPRNFLKWEPWCIKPLNKFHGLFHHSIPNIIHGLIPQVIIVVVIYFLR